MPGTGNPAVPGQRQPVAPRPTATPPGSPSVTGPGWQAPDPQQRPRVPLPRTPAGPGQPPATPYGPAWNAPYPPAPGAPAVPAPGVPYPQAPAAPYGPVSNPSYPQAPAMPTAPAPNAPYPPPPGGPYPPGAVPPQLPRQWGGPRSPAVDNRMMWIGADGSVRYAPTYQPQPPPARRGRRWPFWVALGVVGVLLLCGVPAAFVASRLPDLTGDRAEAANQPPGHAPSPGPNSPARVRTAWVTDQINKALKTQSDALLSGDQKAFLGTADPAATKLVVALKRRFGSLRALQVTTYEQTIAGFPARTGGTGVKPGWTVRLDIEYCFVVRGCDPDTIRVGSTWAETAAGVRMTSLDTTTSTSNGPRPWETAALKAAVGKRAVVATTSRYASRLPALLRQADKAAAVADKFVIGAKPPDRYRIFVAGSAEWKRWYGGELPDWSVGFATAVSDDRMEVVLNVNEIQTDYLDEVLRHELGHVATLSSDDYADDSNFWLVEGMAEYIQESGRPVGRYDGRFAVRRYLDADKWDGDVTVTAPAADAPDWQVAARYGIGYYAVRRMAERFGRAKMVQFFSAVVLKEGNTLDNAAQKIFGVSWTNVNTDCAKYIRRQT